MRGLHPRLRMCEIYVLNEKGEKTILLQIMKEIFINNIWMTIKFIWDFSYHLTKGNG